MNLVINKNTNYYITMKTQYVIIILVLLFASIMMLHRILTLYKQDCKHKNDIVHKTINNGNAQLITDIIYITLLIIVSTVTIK
jgi:hypothetical protein